MIQGVGFSITRKKTGSPVWCSTLYLQHLAQTSLPFVTKPATPLQLQDRSIDAYTAFSLKSEAESEHSTTKAACQGDSQGFMSLGIRGWEKLPENEPCLAFRGSERPMMSRLWLSRLGCTLRGLREPCACNIHCLRTHGKPVPCSCPAATHNDGAEEYLPLMRALYHHGPVAVSVSASSWDLYMMLGSEAARFFPMLKLPLFGGSPVVFHPAVCRCPASTRLEKISKGSHASWTEKPRQILHPCGLLFPRNGIFDYCDKNAIIDHAVVLVGYGRDQQVGKKCPALKIRRAVTSHEQRVRSPERDIER